MLHKYRLSVQIRELQTRLVLGKLYWQHYNIHNLKIVGRTSQLSHTPVLFKLPKLV